jgi:HD superfamily phosphohydrolase YqeK
VTRGFEILLPQWAIVRPERRRHIERVVDLLTTWGTAMGLQPDELSEWLDAGRLHDALRDANEARLREILPDSPLPFELLHGPAAARMLASEGEIRAGLLEALEWHTTGRPGLGATARALYCADFLEPGRQDHATARAELARRFPIEPTDVYRDVVRLRLKHALNAGMKLHPLTVETWNSIVG